MPAATLTVTDLVKQADERLQEEWGDLLPAPAQREIQDLSGYSYLIRYRGEADGRFYWTLQVRLDREGISPEQRDSGNSCLLDLRLDLYTGELVSISCSL